MDIAVVDDTVVVVDTVFGDIAVVGDIVVVEDIVVDRSCTTVVETVLLLVWMMYLCR